MKIAVLGWNYKKTPIEIREQLILSPQQRTVLAKELKGELDLEEILILSTCNRTEFFFRWSHAGNTVQILGDRLMEHWGLNDLREYCYEICDLYVIQHLFRVSSSLDSMVLGETQILGQVKDAYHLFFDAGLLGGLFKTLFPKAFSTAKRVRTETQISNYAVSISFAAIELAKRIFSDLSTQTVLIIGAGEMAEIAAKHLIKNGVSRLLVTNRTFHNAVTMAEQYHGSAIRFEQLEDHLINASIIIGSTGANKFVITQGMVKKYLKQRRGRPLFFIDIAVPRDVDPTVNDLANVYCYDIDDLQNVVDRNREERERQAQVAEKIIEEELEKADHWLKTQSTIPTIRALRELYHNIATSEIDKVLPKLNGLSPEEKDTIVRMTYKILNRVLHNPTVNLKSLGSREDIHLYLDTLTELFDLSPTSLTVENKVIEEPPLQLFHGRSKPK